VIKLSMAIRRKERSGGRRLIESPACGWHENAAVNEEELGAIGSSKTCVLAAVCVWWWWWTRKDRLALAETMTVGRRTAQQTPEANKRGSANTEQRRGRPTLPSFWFRCPR
jgi:hypothetical protein